MTIRSQPPGALVYVDDYEIGTTPVSANFTYYGTRKIRLVKDGYETLTVMQPIAPPWYEYPVIEFFSENLVPGQIRDQRGFCYQLRPQAVVPTERLLGQAEALRQQARASAVRVSPGEPGQLPSARPTPVSPPAGVEASPWPRPGSPSTEPESIPPGDVTPPGGWLPR